MKYVIGAKTLFVQWLCMLASSLFLWSVSADTKKSSLIWGNRWWVIFSLCLNIWKSSMPFYRFNDLRSSYWCVSGLYLTSYGSRWWYRAQYFGLSVNDGIRVEGECQLTANQNKWVWRIYKCIILNKKLFSKQI